MGKECSKRKVEKEQKDEEPSKKSSKSEQFEQIELTNMADDESEPESDEEYTEKMNPEVTVLIPEPTQYVMLRVPPEASEYFAGASTVQLQNNFIEVERFLFWYLYQSQSRNLQRNPKDFSIERILEPEQSPVYISPETLQTFILYTNYCYYYCIWYIMNQQMQQN